jgi:hypothetical protein
VIDGFTLDRGEETETALPAAMVVGFLNPGHDGEPQLLLGFPSLTIQDVILEQAKNYSMAALSPQALTRPIEPARPWWASF